MISLLVPWWGGGLAPLKRTIDSCSGIVDEVVIVHQKLFNEDAEAVRSLTPKIATTNWNETFEHGFGHMTMQGVPLCNGPWILWLGTGETIAEQFVPIRQFLSSAKNRELVYRVSHHNDSNLWQRFFCPSAGNIVSGLIHEDVNGEQSNVIARFQDTPKESSGDPFKDEVLKWYKVVVYNWNYLRLGNNPSELGNTHPGWMAFVRGAWDGIVKFCDDNSDLIEAGKSGDREAFYAGVRRRMEEDNRKPKNVNFNPTGEPFSEGALPLAT